MALIYTPAPETGSPCKDFECSAVDGKTYRLSDFASAEALVVMFICNHCPYVKAIEERLVTLVRELAPRGVQFIGVCSNDAENYPEDSFDNLKARWQELGYGFPYLVDKDQIMAEDFGAVCTPDFFVYDRERKLTYRGRLDDNWKEPDKVTHRELKEAVENTLAQRPTAGQKPSMGCSIKWKR